MSNDLDISVLNKSLSYNPETGLLSLKEPCKHKALPAGSLVGHQGSRGYMRIKVGSHLLHAHRVAWALFYGEWPDRSIDHINHIQTDNRIENLRLATHGQNMANRRAVKGFKSKGVRLKDGRWIAQIMANKKQIHIGSFDTFDEAAHAYNKAAVALHGQFASLNPVGCDKEINATLSAADAKGKENG